MDHYTAHQLLASILPDTPEVWADLGAGTGLFTEVLRDHLPIGSEVHALDKSPHMLWRLTQRPKVPIHIHDHDFTRPLPLPICDGFLLANALHYVPDPQPVLEQMLACLHPAGRLVLIEYETQNPISRWVPYPIPFQRFTDLATTVGLAPPTQIGQVPSVYGHDHIYAAWTQRVP